MISRSTGKLYRFQFNLIKNKEQKMSQASPVDAVKEDSMEKQKQMIAAVP